MAKARITDFITPVDVDFQDLQDHKIDENCMRIYCSQHGSGYKLQLRAHGPLVKNPFRKEQSTPKHLIATATLDREDLIELRAQIDHLIKHS